MRHSNLSFKFTRLLQHKVLNLLVNITPPLTKYAEI